MQHFFPPSPITIIKPLLEPLIFSSFSLSSPYIMQHDLYLREGYGAVEEQGLLF
jgi:hypothetical protein